MDTNHATTQPDDNEQPGPKSASRRAALRKAAVAGSAAMAASLALGSDPADAAASEEWVGAQGKVGISGDVPAVQVWNPGDSTSRIGLATLYGRGVVAGGPGGSSAPDSFFARLGPNRWGPFGNGELSVEAIPVLPTVPKSADFTLDVGIAAVYDCQGTGDIDVSLPSDATQNHAIGTKIVLRQVGSGTVEVVPDASVDLRAQRLPVTTDGPSSSVELVKSGPNSWVASNSETQPVLRLQARDVDPHAYGPIDSAGNGGKAAILAALTAAEAAGGSGVVRLRPNQTYLIEGTLSLSGFSSTIMGTFGSAVGTDNGLDAIGAGTRLKAVAQTGPLLDLKGWKAPSNFFGRAEFGGFTLEGDGVPRGADVVVDDYSGNPLVGMRIDGGARSLLIRDITTLHFPGPGMFIRRLYLSDVERVTFGAPTPPVDGNGAKQPVDVPWLALQGCNCNRFRGLGFRSLYRRGNATYGVGDVSAKGAITFTNEPGTTTGGSHLNLLESWWFENLHAADGGTFLHHAASRNLIQGFQFIDCSAQNDSQELSSYMRFVLDDNVRIGGNEIRSEIPGRGSGSGTSIKYGIEMRQNFNAISGIKGYRGYNVLLDPAVTKGSIRLSGSLNHADWVAVSVEGGGSIPAGVVVEDDFYPGTGFTPANPSHWNPAPTKVHEALNQLAAKHAALEARIEALE